MITIYLEKLFFKVITDNKWTQSHEFFSRRGENFVKNYFRSSFDAKQTVALGTSSYIIYKAKSNTYWAEIPPKY